MTTRTVQRRPRTDPVTRNFSQFLTLGAEAKSLTDRATLLKADLVTFVKENGEVDPEKGHKVHLLPTPVMVGTTKYVGFMHQRKTPSPTFNEEAAEALCEEKGFDRSDYITTQEYVDQDKIARLYAEDRLTDEEFNALLVENEPTWAFVPVKG